jgi:hypothetical protein
MGEKVTVTPASAHGKSQSRALPAPLQFDLTKSPVREKDELESAFLHRLLIYETITMDLYVREARQEIVKRGERIKLIDSQYHEALKRDKKLQPVEPKAKVDGAGTSNS